MRFLGAVAFNALTGLAALADRKAGVRRGLAGLVRAGMRLFSSLRPWVCCDFPRRLRFLSQMLLRLLLMGSCQRWREKKA